MSLAVPVLISALLIYALTKKVDIPSKFCEGAKENLITAFELCPMLILLMTAINIFTASGLAEALTSLLEPLTSAIGFPAECTPLMLIRPISGSGSLAVLESILSDNPVDSRAARTACIMMGATETTLYTIAVYFAAVKKKPHAGVFASSFAADIAGFIFASVIAGILFV